MIVFVTALSFSDAEIDLLWERVITPYLDYHNDLVDHPPLATLSIEKIETPGYPYSADFIFEEGIHGGWLMSATDGILDWWFPDCLGPCPITDEFRAAYPEIMAIIEP